MNRNADTDATHADATHTDDFVNYTPAMPNLTGESSVLQRIADGLFGRNE
ncbi:hypothetical protein [Halorubrum sp. DTA98]